MIIDTRNIPEGSSVLTDSVTLPEELVSVGKVEPIVHCSTEVSNYYGKIRLIINFNSVSIFRCARCLKEYRSETDGNFEYLLVHSEYKDEYEGEECSFFNDHDHTVDIRNVLYEEIILAQPMMHICDDSCEGFQVEEKDDDNKQSDDEVDSRWAALKKLKK